MAKSVLFQGAESKIYLEEIKGRTVLVKERFQKKYRNPNLDMKLTKERIKAESKNMEKCRQAGLNTPEIYKIDLEKRLIYMEYLEGSKTTKEIIDMWVKEDTEAARQQASELAKRIGRDVAKMHRRGIVHGDLTTSNMLLNKNDLVFIDFGLSCADGNIQEKAVDLYVLERALLSTHENAQEFFNELLDSYKTEAGEQGKKVLTKLLEVRARGRKRTMVG